MLHWDGKRWSHIPTPQPGGNSGADGLFGVTCVAASGCWAVGTAGPSLNALSNEVVHWKGKRWSG